MPIVYIAAGSNIPCRHQYLERARQLLTRDPQIRLLRSSPVYETDPVGGPPQEKYLNVVWEATTNIGAPELLAALLEIERKLGRIRREKNGPRAIDLDILFYGDKIFDRPGLVIPHPRLQDRTFVLEPLMDLNSSFMHPKLRRTVRQLWKRLYDDPSKS